MKIAVISINDPSPNYGNRLQNYAVDYVLKELGYDVSTLYVEKQIGIKEKIKKFVNVLTVYKFAKNPEYSKRYYTKRKKYLKFNKKYLNMKRIVKFEGLSNQYDYFVIGSDQVWNPSWYDDKKKEAYLLSFAKKEQKICFSPSFGVEQLPKEWEEHFRVRLQQFEKISVREYAGAEIVKRLVGKEAEVLIDPTLMLDASEWRKISRKLDAVNLNKGYILTYFLGGRSQEKNKYISNLSEKHDLDVYNLLDIEHPEIFMADPSEFIYLVDNAKIILTDSFHACVFSFLFNKPFVVFERDGSEKGMMSRMDTLLSKFDLKRKYIDSGLENDIFEHDYSKGEEILNYEREKVKKFLLESFG